MLQSEKVDSKRFYKFKNIQKWYFIHDFFSGEDVIIMLKGKNAVTKRVSELPQSMKFEKIRLL
jgi:hypothetical protein